MERPRGWRSAPTGRVLVVGAGPVGLVTTLLLRHHDVDVTVIDRSAAPVSESRATDLHPATLARLDPYGVTTDLLDIGQVVRGAVVHTDGGEVGRIPFGRPGSPFPFGLTVPQCTTEGVLQEHLARRGITVERGCEVTEVRHDPGGVDVTTRTTGGGPTTLRYDWVVACDGAASTVRGSIGLDFPGATDPRPAAIADLEVDLPFPRDEVHLVWRRAGSVHVLPMPVDGYVRLLLDRWPDPVAEDPDPERFLAVTGTRLGLGPLRVHGVRWTSAFRMHRRHVDRARVGRVLLAGDAAHVCPPIGGQGLNLGVGDAAAVAPALAAVLRGHVPAAALDVVARRRLDHARRSGRLAWWATRTNTPRHRAVEIGRDATAPLAVRVVAPLVRRWLASS